MVKFLDVRGERAGQQEAEQRHKGLKPAEIRAGDQAMRSLESLDREALADRDGKRIHGQRDGSDEQVKKLHSVPPACLKIRDG